MNDTLYRFETKAWGAICRGVATGGGVAFFPRQMRTPVKSAIEWQAGMAHWWALAPAGILLVADDCAFIISQKVNTMGGSQTVQWLKYLKISKAMITDPFVSGD